MNLTRLGCGSDESLLLIRMFFAGGNHADRMFFQLDNSWEEQDPQIKPLATAMPFIREDLFREHYRNWEHFPEFYHLPFYRYARFAPEIGFREIVMSLDKDSSDFEKTLGFSPLNGTFRGSRSVETRLKSPANPKLGAITEMCRQHGCQPHFFTAPFLALEGADFEAFLGAKLPNYRDFSWTLPEERWFRDANHLNRAGAEEFTRMFITAWFSSE